MPSAPTIPTPWWRHAAIGPLLRSRVACLALLTTALALVALAAAGLSPFPCQVHQHTGLTCPGCGLTRSCVALLSFQPARAFELHAFGPLMLLGITLLAITTALPRRARLGLAGAIERLEHRTAAHLLIVSGLLGYWLVRLAL
ncbi:MAG: DUF2752 domain-containing protein [Planctomycetota bacterium]